jgi:tetrahydromethanopterin S-methyltransferase subunit G
MNHLLSSEGVSPPDEARDPEVRLPHVERGPRVVNPWADVSQREGEGAARGIVVGLFVGLLVWVLIAAVIAFVVVL